MAPPINLRQLRTYQTNSACVRDKAAHCPRADLGPPQRRPRGIQGPQDQIKVGIENPTIENDKLLFWSGGALSPRQPEVSRSEIYTHTGNGPNPGGTTTYEK